MVGIGDIVLYVLDEYDAAAVNRRRTNSYAIQLLRQEDRWPQGAQAHVGDYVRKGQTFPLIVYRAWEDLGEERVDGQVILPGTDVLWVQARRQGFNVGEYTPRR